VARAPAIHKGEKSADPQVRPQVRVGLVGYRKPRIQGDPTKPKPTASIVVSPAQEAAHQACAAHPSFLLESDRVHPG
jgi:hypothetical protein